MFLCYVFLCFSVHPIVGPIPHIKYSPVTRL
jgi:hypothetical protein